MALLTADPAQPRALRLALGDSVGGVHCWPAPTTNGRQLAAVHTPHIGGLLQVYRQDGPSLTRRRLVGDVNTRCRVTLTTVLAGSAALAALLDDGQVVRVGPSERPPSRR